MIWRYPHFRNPSYLVASCGLRSLGETKWNPRLEDLYVMASGEGGAAVLLIFFWPCSDVSQ